MADQFDWLLGEAIRTAAAQIEGRVEHEFRSPFSVPVMDSGFKFNELVIAETKRFVKETFEISEELSRIVIFTSLNVNLVRGTSISRSESKLYIIRGKDGKLSALLYMGCSIEEHPPIPTTTP